ncbi:hypothetical protein MRX96_026868 [Rhipicephalus microplus]
MWTRAKIGSSRSRRRAQAVHTHREEAKHRRREARVPCVLLGDTADQPWYPVEKCRSAMMREGGHAASIRWSVGGSVGGSNCFPPSAAGGERRTSRVRASLLMNDPAGAVSASQIPLSSLSSFRSQSGSAAAAGAGCNLAAR